MTTKTTTDRTTGTPRGAASEVVLDGLGVSPGIAIGTVALRDGGNLSIPEYTVPTEAIPAERERFRLAVEQASDQIRALQEEAKGLPPAAAEELGYLLDAHLQMLQGSRLVRGVDRCIAEHGVNAEAAVQMQISEIAEGFRRMGDSYLAARVDDIREAGARLVRCLVKAETEGFENLAVGSVIVTEELTPAETALLDPKRIGGFATVLGGAEGHTAIMARSLGLPAVVGVAGLTGSTCGGCAIIVDGSAGRVILNPTPETLRFYEARKAELLREERQLALLRDRPAITRDGTPVALEANIELPLELDAVLRSGAVGIGLFRSEFLYMNRPDLPSEDEQFAAFRAVVEGMSGRSATIRTLDIGGEKLADSLDLRPGPNPVLGLRAVRLGLKMPDLLDTQMAAILRAGAYGPVRILLPMVSTTVELRRAREMMMRTARRLRKKGVAIADPLPPLGCMIEVPGAALSADALASEADFFAIGTNDLIQYTLAIDRADDQVAHLYDPLHPAVLRLIQFATEAALRARIPVSVCGEMAGDPRYTALLMGLGIRDLSMAAAKIPRVKQRIRNLDLVAAARRARIIMDQSDSGRIAMLLDDFNTLA